jgi:hypothetical protein
MSGIAFKRDKTMYVCLLLTHAWVMGQMSYSEHWSTVDYKTKIQSAIKRWCVSCYAFVWELLECGVLNCYTFVWELLECGVLSCYTFVRELLEYWCAWSSDEHLCMCVYPCKIQRYCALVYICMVLRWACAYRKKAHGAMKSICVRAIEHLCTYALSTVITCLWTRTRGSGSYTYINMYLYLKSITYYEKYLCKILETGKHVSPARTSMRAYACMYVYIYIYIYTHICINSYIYIYT